MGFLIRKGHFIGALLFTVVASVILYFFQLEFNNLNVWVGFPVSGPVDMYFCEGANMAALIREPINTWTNIPFLFLACVFALTGLRDMRNYSTVNMMSYLPIYSFLFAVGSLYMFIGSSLFHSSLTSLGEQMDLSAVFFISLLPFVYNLHKAYNIQRFGNPVRTTKRTIAFFVGLLMILFFLLTAFKWHLETLYMVPILILLTAAGIVHMIWKHPGKSNIKYLVASGLFMSIGIAFFIFDRVKLWCDSGSLIQFHALWHLCCAVSVYTLYLYLRSETVYSIYKLRIR